MAMCMMPLLIKAKMTYENYRDLLLKAVKQYHKSYLKENYRYDGLYFTLDVCEMDDYNIFHEAELIAQYADPTEYCVGLIYDGSISYSTAELYFSNGKCVTKNPQREADVRYPYEWRKREFLSKFPEMEFKSYPEIEDILTAKIEYDTYKCVGMQSDVLAAIFSSLGCRVKKIQNCEGEIYVELEDCKGKYPSELIASYFGYKSCVLFSSHHYLSTPNEVMILLYGGLL